ncbi:MAG: TetR/AcrR family transcriptional regulator [Chloroflexota bacterium]
MNPKLKTPLPNEPSPAPPSGQAQALLAAVSEAMAKSGGMAISMNELAKKVNVSRPALYYHFRDKTDIIRRLAEEVTEDANRLFAEIDAQEFSSAQEKLYALCRIRALHIFAKRYNFRLLVIAESALPEPASTAHQNQKKEVLRFYRDIILQGVDSGEFVVEDATTAALSIIGLVNWAAWWFDDERNDAEETAVQLAEMCLNCVLGPSTRGASQTEVLLDNLESSLGQLRQVLANAKQT